MVSDILTIARKLTHPADPQRNDRIREMDADSRALLLDLCRPHSWGAYIDTYPATHAYLTAARVSRDTLVGVCNVLYYDLPPAAHRAMSDYLRHG